MSSLLNWTNNIRRRFASHQNDHIGIEANDIDIGRRIMDPATIYRNRYTWLIVLGPVLFLSIYVTICFFWFCNFPDLSDDKSSLILSRQTLSLTDLGDPTRFRGWIDVQQQGVPNDYARYVGPNAECPFVWLAIALAGSTEQYTDPGLYVEHCGIVRRTSMKPRQKLPDIAKLGLKNHFRGWVDAQNQGVPNDYAYYVEPTENIPFPWLTVALAGSTEQRTCVGMYEEEYGIVRKGQNEHIHDRINVTFSERSLTTVTLSNHNKTRDSLPFINQSSEPSNNHMQSMFVSDTTLSIDTSLEKSPTVPLFCNHNSPELLSTIISKKSSLYMACTTYTYSCQSKTTGLIETRVTLTGTAKLALCGTKSINNVVPGIRCEKIWSCCYMDNCNKCPHMGCSSSYTRDISSRGCSSSICPKFIFLIFYLTSILVLHS